MSGNNCGFEFSSLIQYFKPTFKNHPLLHVLVFLVFIGSFSWSSLAFSFTEDPQNSHTDGYIFISSSGTGPKFATVQQAHDYYFPGSLNKQAVFHNGSWRTMDQFLQVSYLGYIKRSCSDWGYSNPACTETLETNCPEKFSEKRLSIPVKKVLDAEGNETDQVSGNYSGASAVVENGCIYRRTVYFEETEGIPADDHIGQDANGDLFMTETYVSSGESYNPQNPDDTVFAKNDFNEESMSTAALADSLDVLVQPTTSEIGPDGSSITSQSTVEIAVKGKGATITDSTDTIIVTESEGLRKTVTTTETNVIYPDGTKEVITERDVAYEQTDKTVVIITKADGTKVITNAPGSSAGSKSTKTDTYDAEGNLTSSSTTTADTAGSSQEGEAADAKKEGECKEDDEKCDKPEDPKGADGEGQYTPVKDKTFQSVMDGFSSRIESAPFVMASTTFFEVNISQGSCPTWSNDVPMLGTIHFDFFCSNIANAMYPYFQWGLLLIASIAAFRWGILH